MNHDSREIELFAKILRFSSPAAIARGKVRGPAHPTDISAINATN